MCIDMIGMRKRQGEENDVCILECATIYAYLQKHLYIYFYEKRIGCVKISTRNLLLREIYLYARFFAYHYRRKGSSAIGTKMLAMHET